MEQLLDKATKLACVPHEEVRVVRSPYRVCPLGAHIDHQMGCVTGMALDHYIHLAFSPNDDGKIRLQSHGFDQIHEFDLHHVETVKDGWGRYAAGAVLALERAGKPVRRGITGVIKGSLPVGGLSSSAAVTIAYLLALESANELTVDPWENILLEQYVENVHIGLNNGILDQSVIVLSKKDHLLMLDCASGAYELIPQPASARYRIVVAYSGVSAALKSTGYNQRVAECVQAASELLQRGGLAVPPKPHLRDVPHEVYNRYVDYLPANLAKRARHFFTENERVRLGCQAWAAGDLRRLGELITESGRSSVENYECGSPELISLFKIMNRVEGVLGARFSGGGFRGSCIAFCEPGAEEAVRAAVEAEFPKAHPHVADKFKLYFCASGEGACLL